MIPDSTILKGPILEDFAVQTLFEPIILTDIDKKIKRAFPRYSYIELHEITKKKNLFDKWQKPINLSTRSLNQRRKPNDAKRKYHFTDILRHGGKVSRMTSCQPAWNRHHRHHKAPGCHVSRYLELARYGPWVDGKVPGSVVLPSCSSLLIDNEVVIFQSRTFEHWLILKRQTHFFWRFRVQVQL